MLRGLGDGWRTPKQLPEDGEGFWLGDDTGLVTGEWRVVMGFGAAGVEGWAQISFPPRVLVEFACSLDASDT